MTPQQQVRTLMSDRRERTFDDIRLATGLSRPDLKRTIQILRIDGFLATSKVQGTHVFRERVK